MRAQKLLLNRKGQSIVEIALITPLLLAALYVAFDFGFALFTSHLAQNAVREATRIGSILPDCSVATTATCVTAGTTGNVKCSNADPVVQEACTRLPTLLKANNPDVTVTLTGIVGSTCRRMITVSVAGSYNYGLYNLIGLVAAPLSGAAKTLPINRAAKARYELQPVSTNDTSC